MTARMIRNPLVLSALAGMALMIAAAFAQGQDYNWDLLNYHFTTPYLMWHGQLDQHVLLSGLQSRFNPLPYFPAWALISALPPWLATAILAAVAGLNAALIAALVARLSPDFAARDRAMATALCVLAGMMGAITISEAGTSFADIWLSLFVLGALVLAMDASGNGSARKAGMAGLLMGAATGLKLTVVVFAAGLGAAMAAIMLLRRVPLRLFIFFVLAGLIGFAIGGGWWSWRLWVETGNPVFPLFNNVFASPYAPVEALNDKNFLPQSPLDLLRFPWLWAQGLTTSTGGELPVRDARYLVGLLASIIAVPLWLRRKEAVATSALLLGLFFFISFAGWLFLFAILRYAVPIEMLTPVAVLAMLAGWRALPVRALLGSLLALTLLFLMTTRYESWHRAHWSSDWFGVSGINAVHQPGTVYVQADDAPLGFLVANFPLDARFVHIGGNFPLTPDKGFGPRAAALINGAPHLRTLSASPIGAGGKAALARFDMAIIPASCRPIRIKTAPVESCALARLREISVPENHHSEK